jgi:photosystem II stability/assembly factor-like uncharacterized protein
MKRNNALHIILLAAGLAVTACCWKLALRLSALNCDTERLEKGLIKQEQTPAWVARVMRLSEGEDFVAISFLSEKQGWVISRRGTLYATNDGGVSFHRSDIGLPSDGYVVDLLFITPAVGWLAFNRAVEVSQADQHIAVLMKTVDGG